MFIFIELSCTISMFVTQSIPRNATAKIALKCSVQITLSSGTRNAFITLIMTIWEQITSLRNRNALLILAFEFTIFFTLPTNAGSFITTISTIIYKITILIKVQLGFETSNYTIYLSNCDAVAIVTFKLRIKTLHTISIVFICSISTRLLKINFVFALFYTCKQ